MLRLNYIAITIILCVAFFAVPMHGEERYRVTFRNGEIEIGEELSGFLSGSRLPTVNDSLIFSESNPADLITVLSKQRFHARSYIQLTNGDILPGVVLRRVSQRHGEPAHLVVSLASAPDDQSAQVRIQEDFVQRISHGAKHGLPQPGMLVTKNGAVHQATRIRWLDYGVQALTSDGPVTVPFSQVRDLHAPGCDLTSAVVFDALRANVVGESHLVRIETTQGGAYTIPRTQISLDLGEELRKRRNERLRRGDVMAIAPAWTLDTILIDHEDFAQCVIRPIDEVPLSLMPLEEVTRAALVANPPPRLNCNVVGGDLTCGGIAAGLGVGTHSYQRITFALPPGALVFESRLGLDRTVGNGGCVKCDVICDDRAPAWSSGFIRGGDGPQNTGSLQLGDSRTLTLVTNYGDEGRPPGSDPLDIRDRLNWLNPRVRIDLESLADQWESGKRFQHLPTPLASWIPATTGWSLSPEMRHRVKLKPFWQSDEQRWRGVILFKSVNDEPLVFTQRTTINLANAFLPIQAARIADEGAHEFQVLVNGQPHGSTMNGNLKTDGRKGKRKQPEFDSRVWIFSDAAEQQIEIAVSIAQQSQRTTGGLLIDQMSLQPIIENLPVTGEALEPTALLTSLKPMKIAHKALPTVELRAGKLSNNKPLNIRKYPLSEGFGVPVGTEITYALLPEYSRFVALTGLADGWQGVGPYQVYFDGKLHWQSPHDYGRNTPGDQIDIAIPAGCKTMTLKLLGHPSCIGAWAHAGFR